MARTTLPADHWAEHARRWSHFGSPLRPAPEDVRLYRELAAAALAERASARAPAPPPSGRLAAATAATAAIAATATAGTAGTTMLLFGVTPELARVRWAPGSRLIALDRSGPMLRGVWPGAALARAATTRARIQGTWEAMPLAPASIDLALADGCHATLVDRASYDAVSSELCRVLRPDGRLLTRMFVRPDEAESPDAVCDDLRAGRIGSFHAFKWRLAMALHGRFEDGVRLAEVWSAWARSGVDPQALAEERGWSRDAIATIDAYRDASGRYTFPTLSEARALFAEHFVERACRIPSYELGERCPVLALARR